MKNKIYNVALFLLAFIFVVTIFYIGKIYKITPYKNEAEQSLNRMVVNVITESDVVSGVVKEVAKNRANIISWDNRGTLSENNYLKTKTKLFLLGEGLDNKIKDSANLEDIETVVLSADVDIANLDYDIEIGKIDNNSPHYYWLSIHDVQNMTVAIARELGNMDEVGREFYIDNAFNYIKVLKNRQDIFDKSLSKFKNNKVIALGHYFDEFLSSFDIKTVGIFQLDNLDEEYLDELVYNIRYFNIKAVIVPNEYKYAEEIEEKIKNTGALLIELEVGPDYEYENYLDFIRHNVSVLLTRFK